MVPTADTSNSVAPAPVSTTELMRDRVEKMLAKLVSDGQSAEVVDIARKRYERYLTTTSVPTTVSTTSPSTTSTQYSTSTSTSGTSVYSVVTESVKNIMNTTVADISKRFSEVGNTVTKTVFPSPTPKPYSSSTSFTTTEPRVSRLYSRYRVTTPFVVENPSTTKNPVTVTDQVIKGVMTTTDIPTVHETDAEDASWTGGLPDHCRLLQVWMREWVNSWNISKASSNVLPTAEVGDLTDSIRAVNESVAMLGNSDTVPGHNSWQVLPLEGGPLYLIILLMGVICLGEIFLLKLGIIKMTCSHDAR